MTKSLRASGRSAYQPLGLILQCLLILVVSACRTTGEQPAPVPADNTDPGPQPLTEIELVLGPGDFFITDPRIGLADLSSYTATLTRTFEGSVSGDSQQWTEAYVMLRDNSASASQLTYSSTGDIAADSIFFAEVGENAYAVSGAADCTADPVNPEISSIERTDPAGLLSVLLGAEEAGSEEVNDVMADHYTFDERALGKADLEESEGEIWVAADGGHIIRYTLTTIGSAAAFGESVEGTMTWDYSLTEINNTVLPPLPDGCQLHAPLLADASNVLHTPYWLAYSTASGMADATAFYEAQLPGFGWTALSGPIVGESSTFIEFTEGDQTIGVYISAGEVGTDVNIVLYDS